MKSFMFNFDIEFLGAIMGLDWIFYAAALAEISGYSVYDLIKRFRKEETKLINCSIIRLLTVFEKSEDSLTGLWNLSKWDYSSERHKGYFANGKLGILYRHPESGIWKGILYLKYSRNLSTKGWSARKKGDLIEGTYNIEIKEKGQNSYSGTSCMTYRNPKSGVWDSGIFTDIDLLNGNMECEFENTTTMGKAHAIFNQRMKWKEVEG